MGVSNYESPDLIREHQNLEVSIIPKMNCENHLIHVKLDQFTVILTLSNAKRLVSTLRGTIEDIEGTDAARRVRARSKE